MNGNVGKSKVLWGMLTVALAGCLLYGQPGGTKVYAGELSRATETQIAPPVSVIVQPLSIFNPSHIYLLSGSNIISATAGAVSVSASTSATVAVDSLGFTVYVQKWNGTAWETVGSGNTLGGTNSISYSSIVNKSVTSGYYYRARTIHWATEGSVTEQGEIFSSSILVP